MKKLRATFTIDPDIIKLLGLMKGKLGVSKSQLVESAIRKLLVNDRDRIREEISKHRHALAKLNAEWDNKYPDEDRFPDEQ